MELRLVLLLLALVCPRGCQVPVLVVALLFLAKVQLQ
jgi:hypothetical protein